MIIIECSDNHRKKREPVKKLILKFVKLIVGLSIMGTAMAMSYQSYLGLAPWDVLNDGVGLVLGIQVGTASIVFGVVILAIDVIFKEKVGFGTIINMVMIGGVCNIVLDLGFIPGFSQSGTWEHLVPRLALCIGSMVLMSFGMYLYMSEELGAGPRDTLMVMMTKRLPLSVGGVRVVVEGCVFVLGYLLGGRVGLGSVVLVLLGGPIMEIMFRLFKFDVRQVKNQTILETLADFKAALHR